MRGKILFYALGGGHGHVCRAIHIIRALQALSPIVDVVLLGPDRCRSIVPAEIDFRAPASRTRLELACWFNLCLDQFAPDVVVVDTFPRGVMGELKFQPDQRRVLVTRLIPPAYYQKAEVKRACFEYDQIFWSEGKVFDDYPGVEVEPVVDTRPLRCRTDQRFGVLGLGTGIYQNSLQVKEAFELAFEKDCRWIDPGEWVTDLGLQFPLFDLLVSASGYNSFYEARRAGLPTIFIPQKRPYDFQFRRVKVALQSEPEAPICLSGSAPSADELLQFAYELKGKGQPSRPFRGAEQIASELLDGSERAA